MSIAESNFKISYLGKNQVSEYGDFGVFENIFRVEKQTSRETRLVHVSYQPLLPSGAGPEYIDLDVASEITGFSLKKLKELCKKGHLEYITDGSNWYIKRESLEQYTKAS